eukprot:111212_1
MSMTINVFLSTFLHIMLSNTTDLKGYISGLSLPHHMNGIIAGYNHDKNEIHILGGAIYEKINDIQVSRWNTDLYYISTKYSFFNYKVDLDNNYTDLTSINKWNVQKHTVPFQSNIDIINDAQINTLYGTSMYCIGQCDVQIGNKIYFIPQSHELGNHNNYKLVIYDMDTKSFEYSTNYTSTLINPAHQTCVTTNNSHIFIMGGWARAPLTGVKTYYRSMRIYDIVNNIWMIGNDNSNITQYASGCALSINKQYIYQIGGFDLQLGSSFTDIIQRYDINNDEWIHLKYDENDPIVKDKKIELNYGRQDPICYSDNDVDAILTVGGANGNGLPAHIEELMLWNGIEAEEIIEWDFEDENINIPSLRYPTYSFGHFTKYNFNNDNCTAYFMIGGNERDFDALNYIQYLTRCRSMIGLNTTVRGLSWSVYKSFISLPNNMSYYGLITANYNHTVYIIGGKYNNNNEWNNNIYWISITHTNLIEDNLFDIETQTNISWQNVKQNLYNILNKNKLKNTINILNNMYNNCDILFIQEARNNFISLIDDKNIFKQNYHIIF